jgi:hypothetical protein
MTDQNDKSTPPEGDSPPAENVDELKARLQALQTDFQKKEAEAKANQSRADKAEQRLDRLVAQPVTRGVGAVPPQGRPPVRPLPTPPQVQQQPAEPTADDIREIALEKSREVMLLREVMQRGLQLEDVEGIEFADQSELRLRLDVLQQQKEIEELKQSLKTNGGVPGGDIEPEPEPGPSRVKVDTGGQSGVVANKRVQRVNSYRDKAKDLRRQGNFREASWLALRAAHNDPDRRSLVRPEETEEE